MFGFISNYRYITPVIADLVYIRDQNLVVTIPGDTLVLYGLRLLAAALLTNEIWISKVFFLANDDFKNLSDAQNITQKSPKSRGINKNEVLKS